MALLLKDPPHTIPITKTILAVDDEDAIVSLLWQMLRPRGYEFLKARNEAEALHLAQNHEGAIHLAIVDAFLPPAGGGLLVSRMARLRPGLPALFLSEVGERGIAKPPGGRYACLEKPFRMRELIAAVQRLIEPEARGAVAAAAHAFRAG